MKILITGSRGMVASALCSVLEKEHQLLPLTHEMAELSDFDAVRSVFADFCPDAVVHCAAKGSVPFCEENHGIALRDNVCATKNIALCCKEFGASLLFCSSYMVYAGKPEKKKVTENDPANADTFYGKTKVQSEENIRALVPNHHICRIPYQYGLIRGEIPEDIRRAGLIDKVILSYLKKEPLKVNFDSVHFVTNVFDTVDVFKKMIEGEIPFGTYNVASETEKNIGQICTEVFKLLGADEEEIKTLLIDNGEPPCHRMSSPEALKKIGCPMPTFDEGLKRYFKEYGYKFQ